MLRPEPEKMARYVHRPSTSRRSTAKELQGGDPTKSGPSVMPGAELHEPEDWWDRLNVVFLYMTGWRIDSALSLRSGRTLTRMSLRRRFSRHEDQQGDNETS